MLKNLPSDAVLESGKAEFFVPDGERAYQTLSRALEHCLPGFRDLSQGRRMWTEGHDYERHHTPLFADMTRVLVVADISFFSAPNVLASLGRGVAVILHKLPYRDGGRHDPAGTLQLNLYLPKPHPDGCSYRLFTAEYTEDPRLHIPADDLSVPFFGISLNVCAEFPEGDLGYEPVT